MRRACRRRRWQAGHRGIVGRARALRQCTRGVADRPGRVRPAKAWPGAWAGVRPAPLMPLGAVKRHAREGPGRRACHGEAGRYTLALSCRLKAVAATRGLWPCASPTDHNPGRVAVVVGGACCSDTRDSGACLAPLVAALRHQATGSEARRRRAAWRAADQARQSARCEATDKKNHSTPTPRLTNNIAGPGRRACHGEAGRCTLALSCRLKAVAATRGLWPCASPTDHNPGRVAVVVGGACCSDTRDSGACLAPLVAALRHQATGSEARRRRAAWRAADQARQSARCEATDKKKPLDADTALDKQHSRVR